MSHRFLFIITALAVIAAGCGSNNTQIEKVQQPGKSRSVVTVAAVGDIACPSTDDEFKDGKGVETACQHVAVAKLVEAAKPDALLTLGDTQYDYGTNEEFRSSYNVSWGRFRALTRPAVGNHEYLRDRKAKGYFQYFGNSAGDPNKGYYSYDLGAWHLIALNSNCSFVGGCDQGSPQEKWLRRDLRENAKLCTLAYWHHPLFSSSEHGKGLFVTPLWRTLYKYRVDVVLNGHDHVYERFGPQDPYGKSVRSGIREFVVGTGGKEHYDIKSTQPNSKAHNDSTFGILVMGLKQRGYSWEFQPVAGKTFTDAGFSRCR